MMKMMILAPRKMAMTRRQFREYVTKVHGPPVKSVPDVADAILAYQYNFPVEGSSDLSSDLAYRLARATVSGAGNLLRARAEYAAQLRHDVTSRGGTTAAALQVLMPELGPLVARAVAAAAARPRLLSAPP